MNKKSPLLIFLLKRPCHTEWILFFTFWITCAYFYPREGGWNDNSRLDLTYCIVDYKTFIIEQYKDRPGYNTADVSYINGKHYSNKSPASSFFAIPSYLIFKKVAVFLGLNPDDHMFRRWWMVNSVVSFAGAVSAALLYRILITYGLTIPLGAALATFFSLGTIHLGFATMYYPYTIVTMLLLLSFLMLRGVEYRKNAQGSGFFGWFVAGYLAGTAAFTEFPVVIIIFGFSIYAFYLMSLGLKRKDFLSFRCPFYYRFIGYAIGGIMSFAPYLFYVYAAFGKFLNIYSFQSVGFFDEGFKKGFMGCVGFRPTVIYYLLIHPYRGLFFHSPILILCIPGWIMMIKRKQNVGIALLSFYIFASFTIFFAGNFAWWGGWGYGPRYLAPMLPWLFIPIAFLIRESVGPARRAMWVLGIISMMLHITGTAVTPNIPESIDYNLAKDPKFIHNYKSPVLTWSYFAYKDGTLQPNIGTLLGLQRRPSLYPLYVILLFLFSLHYWKRDFLNTDEPIKRFLKDKT